MNGIDDNQKFANKFNILLGYNHIFFWLHTKKSFHCYPTGWICSVNLYIKNLDRYKCNCAAQYNFLFINNPIGFSTAVITIIIYLLALGP